jgi:hypothetical protein
MSIEDLNYKTIRMVSLGLFSGYNINIFTNI